ncbi:MliC family protein [Leisingera sp. SS27]|uniref:MliC family protein n=1 Tax=Leisingera sp. SS27 TaxID=2979462 RepID=UPI00232B3761|nr:MliC family protein [Leisingera sp. SS27]MDC0656555.1 MliC family protein [Leisingera sp. SS27]
MLLAAAAAAVCGPVRAASGQALEETAYSCDGGWIDAVYVETGSQSSVVLLAEGNLVVLKAGPSGSGVRYAPESDTDGYIWHVKGGQGVLAWQEAGRSSLVLNNCFEQ